LKNLKNLLENAMKLTLLFFGRYKRGLFADNFAYSSSFPAEFEE